MYFTMDKCVENFKLLVISDTGLFLGGAERSLYLFLKYTSIPKDNMRVIVPFYEKNGVLDRIKELGIKVDLVYKDKDSTPLKRYRKNPFKLLRKIILRLAYFFKIVACILKFKPKVLYLNSIRCGTAATAGFLLNKKIVWHIRGFEDLFSNKLKGIRLYLIKLLSSKIIVLSNSEKEMLVNFFKSKKLENKIAVIPNGIEMLVNISRIKKDDIIKDIDLSEKNIIGTIGHVAPWKGTDIFVKIALKLIRRGVNVIFLHLGPVHDSYNDFYQKLLELSKEILNEKLFFLGYKENILDYLNLFDIFFFPTRSEGFPRVVLEAMFLGKPVLTTAITGNLDMIENNKSGILVKKDDERQMLVELERLINDKDLRLFLGENARKRVIENYNIVNIANRIDSEIRSQ